MSAGIKFCLVLAAIVSVAPVARAQDDFRTRVAVIPMANQTGDPVNDTICRTVTDTVALVLRLLGTYAVTDSYDEPALADVDTADVGALGDFARTHRFDEVIFGQAEKPEGAYLSFSLRLFSRSAQDVKFRQEAVADTLFDVFDAADSISIGLISQFSDIHIGFGKIEVRKRQGTGTYQVYLNDNRIRYPETGLGKVLNGTYTLSIRQDRLLGLTEIHRQVLAVYEDRTTVVEFDIPTATADEIAYLDSLSRKVEDAGQDPKNLEGLLTELADFQAVAARIDYDDTLSNLCSETVTQAGERATAQLEQAIAQADEVYYARRPKFDEALQTYERISTLLNDVYQIQVVEDTSLTNPVCAVAAGDGSFYVLDALPGLSVRRLADGRTGPAVAIPYDKFIPDALATAVGMAVDPSGNLCYAHPSSTVILVGDRNLSLVNRIPIPGLTQATGHPVCLAISPDGTFYVFTGDHIIVFRPGEDRQTAIEDAVRTSMEAVGWGRTVQAFFDHQGRLLLYDADRGRILRLDYLGNLISHEDLDETDLDSWLSVDGLGYFYVTDPGRNEIRKYSPGGDYLTTIGRYGVKPGEFSVPRGTATLADGTLAVCDSANARIQVLAPRSAPVLLQRVVQYGDRFAAREQAAQQAVRKMEIVTRDVRPMGSLSRFAGTFLSLGAAAGLAVGSTVFAEIADDRFEQYSQATTVADVTSFRRQAETAWWASRGMVVGVGVTAGLGSILFASTLLTAADQTTARNRTVRNLQSSDMDVEYALDTARYRSLRTAQRIGVLTGVLPPILGGALGATMSLLLELDVVMTGQVFALGTVPSFALIAIPPIWSHLYGGRFHFPLLAVGLIADAAAAASLMIQFRRSADWEPVPLGTGGGALLALADRAWRAAQTQAPMLLWIAAASMRLTAGIYDTTHGWLQAKDYNKYRAIRPLNTPVSVRLEPVLRGEVAGLNLAIRY